MNHFLVDRNTDLAGKITRLLLVVGIPQKGTPALDLQLGADLRHELSGGPIDFPRGDSRRNKLGKTIEHGGGDATCGSHFFNLGRRLDDDGHGKESEVKRNA